MERFIHNGNFGHFAVDESSGEVGPSQPRSPAQTQAATKSGKILYLYYDKAQPGGKT